MKTETYKLFITFTAPILGSQPGDPEIKTKYLAAKSGLDGLAEGREDETLPDMLDKGTTVFFRDGLGNPVLMNYQLLGFLKEAARVLNGKTLDNGKSVKNFRSKVASLVNITPRHLPLALPEGGELDYLERPLRAETAQGPRTAIARSEMLPEGTTLKANLEVIDGEVDEDALHELLTYGSMRGIGQWHGSGAYGTFNYRLEKEEG